MPPPYRPGPSSLLRWPEPRGLNSRRSTAAARLSSSIPRGNGAQRVDAEDAVSTSASRARSISAAGPSQSATPDQSRGPAIVGTTAPHHEPRSLFVATPCNLPLAIAASLLQNGSSHESSHE
jgi:hypothetical protein